MACVDCESEIQEGAIGVPITITFVGCEGEPQDISGATGLNILLKPPTGSLQTHAAAYVTDGTDGKIRYTTGSGDISEDGVWHAQGQVVGPATRNIKSTQVRFTVAENLA